MKQCQNCNKTLSEENFAFKDKKTGRRAKVCKACTNIKQRKDRRENPEKHRKYSRHNYEKQRSNPIAIEKQQEANRRYYRNNKETVSKRIIKYREANRERYQQYYKEWAKANPEKRKEYQNRFNKTEKARKYWREYRAKNLEKIRKVQRESKRRFRAKHPDKSRELDQTKRARRENALGSFSKQDIKNIHKTQKGLCYWCNIPLEKNYHIDHYMPLSRNGTNFPDNIVLSCPQCNMRRHNKLPEESKKHLAKYR